MRMIRIILLILAYGGSVPVAAIAAKKESTPVQPAPKLQAPAAALQMLKDSDGALTAAVRTSYLDWAKNLVLAQLSLAKQSVPAEVLGEIEADPTIADATFAAIYPPDPSIFQNYIELRTKLGPAFVQRYRSLVVASSVAQRSLGVAIRSESDDEQPDPEDMEVPTTQPDPDPTPIVEAPDGFTTAIAEFIKSTHSSALEIYDQKSKQQQLVDYLKSKNCDAKLVARLEKPKALGQALKLAMVRLGERPAKRQALPDLVNWLKYLASVYESKPQIPKTGDKDPTRWPLFPMDKAPWPLLMPLSRTMPLDEARFIYEKFEGKHGNDRYHTYGPYHGDDARMRGELKPSIWHWNAWPDRIVHGGVCVVMSGIAIDTHRALCEPAVPAGQPHHSNLVSYHYADGAWAAHIDQAFAGGPPVTHALWMFRDEAEGVKRLVDKSHAGAEYQLGLAAGMNAGLRSYMDSRIAVHLFQGLTESQRVTIGAKLLTNATKTNPYNPKPWYLLAGQTTSAVQGLPLARSIVARVPDADLMRVGKDLKHQKGAKASAAEVGEREYWETLGKFVIRSAIQRHPTPANATDANAVQTLLKQVNLNGD
jgi:hypothetical protein